MNKTLVSWSSGKDSAWLVHVLRGLAGIELGALLTTINEPAQRVAMHAVRVELLQEQAKALALPLWQVPIPSPCPNDDYERAMAQTVERAVAEGFTHVAFGDLFLEDVRRYREARLAGTGLTPLFPLFGANTTALAREMVAADLGARLTCVNPTVLDRSFAGREFDGRLLADLPSSIDPCGERGEFHSFAYRGPMFSRPIPVETGVIIEREGFVFADLTLASAGIA
ncbi:MAG: ATP-binding protein [Acidobacteria bacterium]|nr:MAG: ATP-binding protein [Acidobacteriota bacterium]